MTAVPSHSGREAAEQWLVHCSPERTLVARREGEGTALVKLFEQGSLLDAQQETELARMLAQPGLVRYTGAELDSVTNKPCVRMEYFEGENLERFIALRGPLPAPRAAELLRTLAEVLANLHETTRDGAPHGVVHRDVKPANVFLAETASGQQPVLIDLEHVTIRSHQSPSRSREFTGGTHGYAPPEAYDGAFPQPSFDVFGLGATLFFVLTGSSAFPRTTPEASAHNAARGCTRLALLRGHAPALRELVARTLAVDPDARPSAAELAKQLHAFCQEQNTASTCLDEALAAVHAGEFASADTMLETALQLDALDASRHHQLIQLAANRTRLLARLGGAPQTGFAPLEDSADWCGLAMHIARELPRVNTYLRRFPLDTETLTLRRSMVEAGHRMLGQVLPEVASWKLQARFAEARKLLEATIDAAQALGRVPGGGSLPVEDSGHLPGPLLRNPGQILNRALKDVEKTEDMHEELLGRLRSSEAELDLASAEIVIQEIRSIYSGASEVAAAFRDRLHRLGFYVQRIGAPSKLMRQLADLLDLTKTPHELEKVEDFMALCRDHASPGTTRAPVSATAKGGIRGLLDTMDQLLEEFPHAAAIAGDSASALRDAMRSLSELTWQLVGEAKDKLSCIPVPIRPVQNLLNRIDGMRLLEAFIDLPDQSRASLHDAIERIRMRLDQARTTRDNIARGAKEAMDRGHLTTALYEMERAVGEGTGTDPNLIASLEQAKQLRQELDATIARNHELAAMYSELVDADDSTSERRIEVLEERGEALSRLIDTLGAEKSTHYATDLRDVVERIAQERADAGEIAIAEAVSPEERLAITQRTLRGLIDATQLAPQAETPGRARRILEQWRHKQTEAESQVAVAEAARRRRLIALVAVPCLAVLALIAGGLSFFGSGDTAHAQTLVAFDTPDIRLERSREGHPKYTPGRAFRPIIQFASRLDAQSATFASTKAVADLRLPETCNALADHLSSYPGEAGRWYPEVMAHLQKLEAAVQKLDSRTESDEHLATVANGLVDFGRYANLVGLSLMVAGLRPNVVEFDKHLAQLPKLARLAIPARELDHIRGLLSN